MICIALMPTLVPLSAQTNAQTTPRAVPHIVIIIGGGIAAFKALDIIRTLRKEGNHITPVLTPSAQHFVTPLSVSALAGCPALTDLFDPHTPTAMDHIAIARAADLVLVVPATADYIAKLAAGHADELGLAIAMATDKPIMLAPAMNVRMWENPILQRNLHRVQADGKIICSPIVGDMACGEHGMGHLAHSSDIVAAALDIVRSGGQLHPLVLRGKRILVTSGATCEPLDAVRYISNRSSGKQGTAIAHALLALGADVDFVTAAASVPPPPRARVHKVTTAQDMLTTVMDIVQAKQMDAVVCVAAVADWQAANGTAKHKTSKAADPNAVFAWVETPDILASVAGLGRGVRPRLVIGFSAETDDVVAKARAKRVRKKCDWMVANDVCQGTVFGADDNRVTLLTEHGETAWPKQSKALVGARLAQEIAACLC